MLSHKPSFSLVLHISKILANVSDKKKPYKHENFLREFLCLKYIAKYKFLQLDYFDNKHCYTSILKLLYIFKWMEEPFVYLPLSCQTAPLPSKKKGREKALKSSFRDFVDTEFLEEQFVYTSVHRWKREEFIIPQVCREKEEWYGCQAVYPGS